MTPAPLPSEEIERLRMLLAAYVADDGHMLDYSAHPALHIEGIRALPALLAEIEAGRAGAERVRDEITALKTRDAGWTLQSEEQAEEIASLERDLYAARDENHRLSAEIAALRQAAQPVCMDCTEMFGEETACVVSYDPPPKASQPAGRVEDMARAHRAIEALRKPDISLVQVPNAIRKSIADVIEGLLGAAPASGAEAADATSPSAVEDGEGR